MYIISLSYTTADDKYITLWGPDNLGYCFSKETAGFYENPKDGYHDNDGDMPISEDLANELFQKLPYDDELKMMIPNTRESWEKLGVKMTRLGLVRLKKSNTL